MLSKTFNFIGRLDYFMEMGMESPEPIFNCHQQFGDPWAFFGLSDIKESTLAVYDKNNEIIYKGPINFNKKRFFEFKGMYFAVPEKINPNDWKKWHDQKYQFLLEVDSSNIPRFIHRNTMDDIVFYIDNIPHKCSYFNFNQNNLTIIYINNNTIISKKITKFKKKKNVFYFKG